MAVKQYLFEDAVLILIRFGLHSQALSYFSTIGSKYMRRSIVDTTTRTDISAYIYFF